MMHALDIKHKHNGMIEQGAIEVRKGYCSWCSDDDVCQTSRDGSSTLTGRTWSYSFRKTKRRLFDRGGEGVMATPM